MPRTNTDQAVSHDSRWLFETTTRRPGAVDGSFVHDNDSDVIWEQGALHPNKPSREATIFVREVIQNFWDSCDERNEKSKNPESDILHCDAHLKLEFSELEGDEKDSFLEELGIQEMLSITKDASPFDAEDTTGFRTLPDVFETMLIPTRKLRILKIIEQGSTGMHGEWESSDKSKLYSAAMEVGGREQDRSRGGSWGKGKMGAIRASKIRTILYYTSHTKEIDPNDSANQRFLAVSVWGRFKQKNKTYTGWGFQRPTDEDSLPKPLTDNDAADKARAFSIETRDPKKQEETGTTICIIEPCFDPFEIKEAIERWWWPAITRGQLGLGRKLDISITDFDGETIEIAPEKHDVIGTFVKAYEKLRQRQGQIDKKIYRTKLITPPNRSDHEDIKSINIGNLDLFSTTKFQDPKKLVIEKTSDGEEIKHETFIAMIRKPGMVSHYYVEQNTRRDNTEPPFIRGMVFVDGDEANKLVGSTEGPLHHWWPTATEANLGDNLGQELVSHIRAKLSSALSAFRRDLRPANPESSSPTEAGIGLTGGLFLGGKKKGDDGEPPDTDPGDRNEIRSFSIENQQQIAKLLDNNHVSCRKEWKYAKYKEGQDPQKVKIIYRFLLQEDGKSNPKKTLPLRLASVITGDWVVTRNGTQKGEDGLYQLWLEGTFGERTVDHAIETEGLDADWASMNPGQFKVDYEWVNADDEREVENE